MENGYVDTSLGGPDTVQIIDSVDDPSLVEHDNQLRATITHSVPTFFLKVFGIDSVDIQRAAVAQYTLPLFLGSPEAYLGADPSRGLAPGFWVSIHGTWAKKNHGDRYGDGCLGEATGLGCLQNPEHRPSLSPGQNKRFNGQLLAITIPIAADYTCTGLGCRYRFKYVYTGDVNDTTTWTAFVVGNPIRIVE